MISRLQQLNSVIRICNYNDSQKQQAFVKHYMNVSTIQYPNRHVPNLDTRTPDQ